MYRTDFPLYGVHVSVAESNTLQSSCIFYALDFIPKCKVYDTLSAAQMTLKTHTEFRKLNDCGLKKLVPELLKVELSTFSEVVSHARNTSEEDAFVCELGAGSACFDELDSEDSETIRYACAIKTSRSTDTSWKISSPRPPFMLA